MRDARQRPPFLEEALQPVAVGVEVVLRDRGGERTGVAPELPAD